MLALPDKPTDRLGLADWLEIAATTSRNGYSSLGDLERAIQRAALLKNSQAIEAKLADVVSEVESRIAAAGDGYPFRLSSSVLSLDPDAWTERSAYLFCLGLTNAGNAPDGLGTFPERLFEVLCTVAAANFLGGDAIRFGSPRHRPEIQASFGEAVEQICIRLGEGGGYSQRKSHWSKDWGVDVMAWRALPDSLPGQLVMFGGCASGKDWHQKLRECDPSSWCSAWMKVTPASQILRAFFVPRRLDTGESWLLTSWKAGLLFDRCRIAQFAPALPKTPHYGNAKTWARKQLKALAA